MNWHAATVFMTQDKNTVSKHMLSILKISKKIHDQSMNIVKFEKNLSNQLKVEKRN